MKKILAFIPAVTVMATLSLMAQNSQETPLLRNIADSIRINSAGRIQILISPEIEAISRRDSTHTDRSTLKKNDELGMPKKIVMRAGYRIQVYTGNKRLTAKTRANKIAEELNMDEEVFGIYLTYKAPYWRLRVGDFATEQQAKQALTDLKNKFPTMSGEMRIVRDRIKHLE